MDFGNRGIGLVNGGKTAEAADCFWLAADSAEEEAERLTWLKNAAQACEQSDRAESALEGYLEYANIKKQNGTPCELQILVRIASLLQTFQRLPEAAGVWAEAAEVEPGSAEIRANYGAVLASIGQHAQAVTQLQSAVTKKPDLPAVVFTNLAASLRALGRGEEASQVMHILRPAHRRRAPMRATPPRSSAPLHLPACSPLFHPHCPTRRSQRQCP